MKYKLSFDTVFDTQTKTYLPVDSGFDKDATGNYIVFNVCMQGNSKACDFADANNYQENKSFDKLIAFFTAKKVPYIIDQDTDYSDIKKIKVRKGLAKDASGEMKAEDAKVAAAMKSDKGKKYDLDKVSLKVDEEKAEETYKANINELRIVNTSENTISENDIANNDNLLKFRDGHLMKAFKVVKDNYPLYYQILMALQKVYLTDKNDPRCSTMAVSSAGELLINIPFALSNTIPQLVFILCHEASHVALKHIPRCMAFDQDPRVNNIAGDLIINKMIADDLEIAPGKPTDKAEFPNGGLYDPNLDLTTETIETLYAKVSDEMNRLKDMKVIYELFEEILNIRFKIAIASMNVPDKLKEIVEKQIESVDKLLENIADAMS